MTYDYGGNILLGWHGNCCKDRGPRTDDRGRLVKDDEGRKTEVEDAPWRGGRRRTEAGEVMKSKNAVLRNEPNRLEVFTS